MNQNLSSSNPFSRRSFLTTSTAIGAGRAVAPALEANEKTNLAWIGVGIRGNYLLDMFYESGLSAQAPVVAICDAYKGYQEGAKDKVISKENKTPRIYDDYRELLANTGIDAIVIATPEHLHHAMTLAALNSKKHIYLEKPLAHSIEQGNAIVKAAAASGQSRAGRYTESE
jgi:predicted dehydrogenase